MRLHLAALACLSLLALPAHADDGGGIEIDPEAWVRDDGIGASLHVAQTYPDNCADCGGVWVDARAETDGRGADASLEVCRGGFVVICVIDEDISL